MTSLIRNLAIVATAAVLGACSTMQDMMPDWMPGSGAIGVHGSDRPAVEVGDVERPWGTVRARVGGGFRDLGRATLAGQGRPPEKGAAWEGCRASF